MGRIAKLTENDMIDAHVLITEYSYTVSDVAKNILKVSQSTLSTRYKYFKYAMEVGDIQDLDKKLDLSREKLKRLGFKPRIKDKLDQQILIHL